MKEPEGPTHGRTDAATHRMGEERVGELELPHWAVVSPQRASHIARVADLLERWAELGSVPDRERARWRRAAALHDALRDAPAEVLARYTPQDGWSLSLWHGPAAAAAAESHGERDAGVLEAVRYHSVGSAAWDDAGRMLYLADYLEPGRSHERAVLDELARRVPGETAAVLREVASRRIRWLLKRGRPLGETTWRFWNSLVAGDSSSPR